MADTKKKKIPWIIPPSIVSKEVKVLMKAYEE